VSFIQYFLASYGTILSDYKRSMPRQLKMVTAEDVLGLFSDHMDSSLCTSGVESTKQVRQAMMIMIAGV